MRKNFVKEILICIIILTCMVSVSLANPNSPALTGNMIPVKWNGNNWVVTDATDGDWYDYSEGKWANIMLRDGIAVSGVTDASNTDLILLKGKVVTSEGSMFVWIPRYTYKISGTNINIKWSSGANDDTNDNYLSHPAFFSGEYLGDNPNLISNYTERNGVDNELTGFWTAKFMASEENGRLQSKPNKTPVTSYSIGNAFQKLIDMKNEQAYGINIENVNTRMTKGSEWGAVAYLTKAIGTVPNVNGTGRTGVVRSRVSTTGNEYGIFDLNGLKSEFVASFVTSGIINSAAQSNVGNMTSKENNKNVDRILLTSMDSSSNNYNKMAKYYGMAVNETYDFASVNHIMPATIQPVFVRSGMGATTAGIFAYAATNGAAGSGFRPTIAVLSNYMTSDMSLFDTDASVMSGDYLVLNIEFSVKEDWKFPLTGSETLKNDIFKFVDIRLIRNSKTVEIKQEELNPQLLSMRKEIVSGGSTDTWESIDISDITASSNPTQSAGKYSIKVRIGGNLDDDEANPVFFPIAGMDAKVVIDRILLKDSTGGKELKVSGITKNKVTLAIYGTPVEMTSVGLIKIPSKTDYYLEEELNIDGLELQINYGKLAPGIIRADRLNIEELVPSYDTITNSPGSNKKVSLKYNGMDVSQGGEYEEFIINVSEERPRTVNMEFRNGYTGAATLHGTGTYYPQDTVTVAATVNPGYRFKQWARSDEGEFKEKTEPTTTFTMPNNDVTVYGEFYKITHITVNTEPQKEFERGSAFGLGTGSFTAHFEDGSALNITLDTTGVTSYDVKKGDILNTLGTQTVTISLGGITYSYEINIIKEKYDLTYLVEPNVGGKIENSDNDTVLVPTDGENTFTERISYDTVVSLSAKSNDTYEFIGWESTVNGLISEENLTNSEISFTMPQQNVLLRAKFRLKEYDVVYIAGTGGKISGNATQKVVYGKDGTTVTAVPNGGYIFNKWSDNNINTSRKEVNVTENKTFTANFDKTWTVTFIDYLGGVIDTQVVVDGESAMAPDSESVPVATGYQFTGEWSIPFTNVKNDITTTAQYSAHSYTVTVTSGDTEQGRVTGGGTYHTGEKVNISGTALTGYTFDKWISANGVDFIEDEYKEEAYFYMPPNEVNVTGNFKTKQFSVTYTVFGSGTISGTTEQLINYGANSTEVTAVPNTGCVFMGWSDGIKTVSRHEENVLKDYNLQAIFDGGHKVRFYSDGTLLESVTVMTGGTAICSQKPVKNGYAFTGWDKTLTGITEDIDTNAIFLPRITITPNGGLLSDSGINANIIGRGIENGTLQYIVTESTSEPITGLPKTGDGIFGFDGNWVNSIESNYYRNSTVSSGQDTSSVITINSARTTETVAFEYMIDAFSDSELGITINGELIAHPDEITSTWTEFSKEIETVDGAITIGISYSQGDNVSGTEVAAIRNLRIARNWTIIDNNAYIWAPKVAGTNYVHIKGVDEDDSETVYKLVSEAFVE